VSKSFYKKIDKNPKLFFLDFSVRGVQKHDKNLTQKSDQPWYFFGLRGTNQPRRRRSFCVGVPLAPTGCRPAARSPQSVGKQGNDLPPRRPPSLGQGAVVGGWVRGKKSPGSNIFWGYFLNCPRQETPKKNGFGNFPPIVLLKLFDTILL
jgi:hypothetical protein